MASESIALYIGAGIEVESERTVLETILRGLKERATTAVVLANFNINERQVDFVVATDQVTLLVEAKSASSALRGDVNGPCEVQTRLGRWKATRNAYVQALQAKHALRDAMYLHDPGLQGYPDACVVFTPQLPPDSALPSGDFKVGLCNLSELEAWTARSSRLRWSAEKWQRFAEANGLRRVQAESALDAKLDAAHQVLDRYGAAFTATYGPTGARYLGDSYRMAGRDVALSDVKAALVGGGSNLLIRGRSGCGKSLLALHLANGLLGEGIVPLVIECKQFEGHLGKTLNEEIALLEVRSAADLIAAARRLGRQIAVVVDGYNECPAPHRVRLTRALRAASLRYDALVVVTSQADIDRSDLLPLKDVVVDGPSSALKAKIARTDVTSEPALVSLLEAVNTGIEADLVGQVGRDLSAGASTFALFDYFVRRKLGDTANDGVQLLCALASRLSDRLTFSLSVRELDRLAVDAHVPPGVVSKVQRSSILTQRGDRVGFRHEMFLQAYAAEALVREAGSDAGAVFAAVTAPKNAALRAFLLGRVG